MAKHSDSYFRRLAENPNTRRAVADKFLTPEQLKMRRQIAFDRAPIIPGSTLTNADVARQRKAAVQLQYGPQEQALGQQYATQQTQNRDMSAAYDGYLKELAGHQANVKANTDAANAAVAALVGQQQGQAQTDAQGRQQASQQVAAGRGGAPSSSVELDAQKASTIRQALLGSFGALTANTGRNVTDYADTLAHVVGPGQKLQAGAQGQRALGAIGAQQTSLKRQEGAYGAQFEGQAKSDEARDVLALAALTGKETIANQASKDRNASREAAGHRWASAVNKYGVTNGAWASWGKSPDGQKKRQKAIDDYNAVTHPPKAPKAPKMPKDPFAPGSPATRAEAQVATGVKNAVGAARQLMSHPQASSTEVRALLAAGKVDGTHYTQDEINAAFDLLPTSLGGKGGLSPANVKALHNQGLVHIRKYFPIAKPVKTIPFPRV